MVRVLGAKEVPPDQRALFESARRLQLEKGGTTGAELAPEQPVLADYDQDAMPPNAKKAPSAAANAWGVCINMATALLYKNYYCILTQNK